MTNDLHARFRCGRGRRAHVSTDDFRLGRGWSGKSHVLDNRIGRRWGRWSNVTPNYFRLRCRRRAHASHNDSGSSRFGRRRADVAVLHLRRPSRRWRGEATVDDFRWAWFRRARPNFFDDDFRLGRRRRLEAAVDDLGWRRSARLRATQHDVANDDVTGSAVNTFVGEVAIAVVILVVTTLMSETKSNSHHFNLLKY